MTFRELRSIIERNHIPEDVHLTSDSGWECSSTEMDGVFYNEKLNEITFTQGVFDRDYYSKSNDWISLKDNSQNYSFLL